MIVLCNQLPIHPSIHPSQGLIPNNSAFNTILPPLTSQALLAERTQLHPQSVKPLKFVDGTTLIRLISRGDESAYRLEIDNLANWCAENNLLLNAHKTVEMPSHTPVNTVESYHFLGTLISRDLKSKLNISSVIKRAQQRMYFLWQLKKFNLPKTMMVHFYTAIIESILTSPISYCQGQRQTAACHLICREGDWMLPAPPSGPVHHQDPETSSTRPRTPTDIAPAPSKRLYGATAI
ncbi:hypothetical protein D4764_09G0009860 [Takifugu flavidus]|uniref:Alkylated DNA repair protein AlkB homologue 8 N-terminal domain-containing protein n=1 Tax=Takifugu flavidus TaxID=433684 RepID=A0A5C6MLA0_9TELE|nr:hypothetical protein D4764_09G0009860 [Takifugu flavidus]